ncbi:MAG: glycosyltransferase [Phycisphaerae bacterium]|nr:glycosyltransferase [Phycisphaerae bacterium]
MRIVFVSYEFPPQFGGGIGTYVAAMTRILARRGHHVTVVTTTGAPFPQRDHDPLLEIVRVPAVLPGACGGWNAQGQAGGEPAATLRYWQARSDAVADLLVKMTRAGTIDVIEFGDYRGEANTFLSATVPGRRPVAAVKLHTPLVVLNRYNTHLTRQPLLESFENHAVLSADRLLSPSMALAREMHALVPGIREIDLHPYAADPAFLDHPATGVTEAPEILYVGRLEQRKGVEALVRAASIVLEACPGATLHLVGGDTMLGPHEPSTRAFLQRLIPAALAARIVFHGAVPRERLVERYLRARVCVFPSLFENFPNTCLEAMSLGRCVIGTDNSGMAEMIEDGRSGRVVRAGDVNHLASTLVELFQLSDAERRAMGRAARDRMHSAYHPDRIGEQFERLYGGYLHASGRRPVHQASPAYRLAPVAGTTPEVAFVVPCFNHGAFVGEAIESIRAQTWPRVSTVVIDDGSTDPATAERLDALRSAGVRVIRQDNQGLAAARNAGVRHTDAPFFVPLDADDRVAPEFVERLIPALLEDASLGYAYSFAQFFGASDGRWECPAYDPVALLVQNMSTATALIRRAAFMLAGAEGGYSRDMIYGFEDWDFWLALLAVGYTGRLVPEPLFFYRKHAGASMLAQTQQRRPEMIRRMAAHHRALYVALVEPAITTKDAMFFSEHMEAWRLRQSLSGRANAASAAESDPAGCPEAARRELDAILGSRSWKLMRRLKGSLPYRVLADIRFGPGWDQVVEGRSPAESLERIKSSRSYRLIQGVKRTNAYHLYAARKYGPDFRSGPGVP